jgi:tetratricopeptide (TPR) repeat protein
MPLDKTEKDHLLELLDGLPLAIAQAGAYIQTTGSGLTRYISFYEKQWDELMIPGPLNDPTLKDYPDRSVWTTWTISYQAIREKNEDTANLLLLWSFLDNKDLWYGLFAEACKIDWRAAQMLTKWIGKVANSEIQFTGAMRLLRNYSLVEEITGTTSYATHPVVHQWTRYSQGTHFETDLMQLAIVVVGQCVPRHHELDYYALQRRLLPHAQVCFNHVVETKAFDRLGAEEGHDEDIDQFEEHETFLSALSDLAVLYQDQNKFSEAEELYTRALRGMENTIGPSNESALRLIGNMGTLYYKQGKLLEAEKMYERALRGTEEVLGPDHLSTLNTVHNHGLLYSTQGKLAEAEKMYERALRGTEEVLGPDHPSTLHIVNNLGNLYHKQDKLAEAEKMYERALQRREEVLGPDHPLTLASINNLGNLYHKQGKLAEAEKMYERALRGKEEVLGSTHPSTLDTVNNLGNLYHKQDKLAEAEKMYERALRGYEEVIGKEHLEHHLPALFTFHGMGNIYFKQGGMAKAENMFERAYRGYEETIGKDNVNQYKEALDVLWNMGILYKKQEEIAKAKAVWERALFGFSNLLGPSSEECKKLVRMIERLSVSEEGGEAGDERHREEESAKQDQPKGEHKAKGHASPSTTYTIRGKQRGKRRANSSPSPQKPTKKTSRV